MSKNGRFTSSIQRKKYQDKETIRDSDGWEGKSLAPAARHVGKSRRTVRVWAKRDGKGCPYLPGHRRIDTREFTGGNGTTTYYSTKDLNDIRQAIAALTDIPSYPGLTPIEDAARKLRVTERRVYQLLNKYGEKPVSKQARSKDGRALPHTYVRDSLVEAVQADRGRAAKLGKMSIKEAAEFLGVPYATVQWWIREGKLKPSPGGSARENGVLLDRATVEDWKERRRTEENASPASADFKDAQQLAKHFGKNIITMTHHLRRWVRSGLLIPRHEYRSSKQRRGRYRVRLYEVAEVAKLLAKVRGPGNPHWKGNTATETVTSGASIRSRAPSLPRWDDEAATLYWGEVPIRQFRRHPARNQRELIEAFHRGRWAQTIPDPFRDARKLALTICCLNKSLLQKLIRFAGDGTGEGVMWMRAE
jgi:excisionase family DNA binding protein